MTKQAEPSEKSEQHESSGKHKKPEKQEPDKHQTHEQHEKSETSGLDAARKWLGLVVAVLLLSTAVYGLRHAQAERRVRAAEVSEQMAVGRRQEMAGDYEHAWDSFQNAANAAAEDAMFSRLFLGRLSKQQEQAHAALEELAESWVERVPMTREEGLLAAELAIKMLAADVDAAKGAHKADLLAHIGYAYFQRAQMGGEEATQPAAFYSEALVADPHNPYAHAFWGQLIISSSGSLAEAKRHFAAALSSHREHELVRRLELAALENIGTDEHAALWWQVVNEMRKAGEPLSSNVTEAMITKYSLALGSESDRKQLYAAIPPIDHVELTRLVLKPGDTGGNTVPVKAMLAYSLEAAGKKGEALEAWQELRSTVQSSGMDTYNTMIQEAFKRLGGTTQH